MNQQNFIVRTELEYVTRFADRKQWDALDGTALVELRDHVAGLPSEQEAEHITAKLFDLTCLGLQVALVRGTKDFLTYRDRIIELAMALEKQEAVPAIRAQLALIQELQTEAFWKDVTLQMTESVRRNLRGLIHLIDRKVLAPVYTHLTDQIGESIEVGLTDFSTGINMAQYKRKVQAFIRANENHVAIAKLRHNKPLTPTDLRELERFVYEAEPVESRKRFEDAFGKGVSLPAFIRSLVGMDRNAAKEAFSRFLDESRYSSQQIRFVEMIIDRLTRQGIVELGQLYEPPFTSIHYEGLDGAFGDADAEALINVLEEMEQRSAA